MPQTGTGMTARHRVQSDFVGMGCGVSSSPGLVFSTVCGLRRAKPSTCLVCLWTAVLSHEEGHGGRVSTGDVASTWPVCISAISQVFGTGGREHALHCETVGSHRSWSLCLGSPPSTRVCTDCGDSGNLKLNYYWPGNSWNRACVMESHQKIK